MTNESPNIVYSSHPWETKSICVEACQKITLLVTQDVQRSQKYALSAQPYIIGETIEPHFGLSLILERQPQPEETNIKPLISGALLSFDVGLGVSQSSIDQLNAGQAEPYRSLYARKITYSLRYSGESEEDLKILGEMEAAGIEGRASLAVSLNRNEALDALQMLQGNDSRLFLTSSLEYQINQIDQEIKFFGSWVAIYDFFAQKMEGAETIYESQLKELIKSLAGAGIISATDAKGQAVQAGGELLFRVFTRQSAVILRKSFDVIREENVYQLKSRPNEYFNLNYAERIEDWIRDELILGNSLQQLVQPILVQKNWDEFISLVVADNENPSQSGRIASRVRSNRKTDRDSRSSQENPALQLAVINNAVSTMNVVTSPGGSGIIHYDPFKIVNHNLILNLNHIQLDDYKFELLDKDRPRNLPVVNKGMGGAPYWKDRLDPKKYWYAPTFEIEQPDPAASPTNSPFLFSFRTTGGMTDTGHIAMEGEIRLTLKKKMSRQTKQAKSKLPKDASLHEVRFYGLSVNLFIPFIDSATGQNRRHAFKAETRIQGDQVIARIRLLNQWVKIAYGALAYENFSHSAPAVRTGYNFEAYRVVKEDTKIVIFGGKMAATQVSYKLPEVTTNPTVAVINPTLTTTTPAHFNASNLTLYTNSKTVQYNTFNLANTFGRSSRNQASSTVGLALAPSVGQTLLPARIESLSAANVYLSPPLKLDIEKIEYARYTYARFEDDAPEFYCNTYGRLYREYKHGAYQDMGCRDVFKLGEASPRLFEEILDEQLTDPLYKVYRVLQQPGYFMILPTTFCISRKIQLKDDEETYKPFIFLNVLLDASNPANNRVELRFTLQPDIPLFKRKQLEQKLRDYDPNPILLYPNDFETESLTLDWLLDSAVKDNIETEWNEDYSGPYLNTLFSMSIPTWIQMLLILQNSGVSGTISFKYNSDTPSLSSNLFLKLDHIRGPWENGPIALESFAQKTLLTNKSEATLEISDLHSIETDGIDLSTIPVELSLAPGESELLGASISYIPNYRYPPSDPVTIQEIRASIEEFEDKIIFISLFAKSRFDEYHIDRLDIEVRILATNEEHIAQITKDQDVAELSIILPLTAALDSNIIEYRIKIVFYENNGVIKDPLISEYFPGDLTEDGIIGVSFDVLRELISEDEGIIP